MCQVLQLHQPKEISQKKIRKTSRYQHSLLLESRSSTERNCHEIFVIFAFRSKLFDRISTTTVQNSVFHMGVREDVFRLWLRADILVRGLLRNLGYPNQTSKKFGSDRFRVEILTQMHLLRSLDAQSASDFKSNPLVI